MRLRCVFFALLAVTCTVLALTYFETIHAFVLRKENVIIASSPCLPSEGRDNGKGKFYQFSSPGEFRLYVFSAFYDDRPSLQSSPVVRIISIADEIVESRLRNGSLDIFCILKNSETTKRVKTDQDALNCGPGYQLNGEDAYTYVFTCPSEGIVPRYLSIEHGHSGRMTSCVPIEFPWKPAKRRSVSVCVPVSYGRLDLFHLIEWTETQRLMGVEHISVYDLYLGDDAKRVFDHYSRTEPGFLEFRKLELIHLFEFGAHILELAISLNDCLYRNIHSSKRIIVSDLDEFIRPQNHSNLPEMIEYLDDYSKNKSIQYVARNCYYFLEVENGSFEVSSPYLKFLKYRWKAPVSPEFHRIKPIILTEACTHLFSHQCLGSTSRYSGHQLMEYIDTSVALNQHYRKCPLTASECKDAMARVTRDGGMLRFKDVLRSKVRQKVIAVTGSAPDDL